MKKWKVKLPGDQYYRLESDTPHEDMDACGYDRYALEEMEPRHIPEWNRLPELPDASGEKEEHETEDMEIKGLLNCDQAEELFYREAAYINDDDAIPVVRAADLLGASAAAYAMTIANRKEESGCLVSWRLFRDSRTTVDFLTLRGFMVAVTYHNAIVQAAREAGTA